MHCNQPFCGNVFNNGQSFGFNNCNPPLVNSGLYPDIVGEGEVTSVTLPDGTIQFFFIPTVKWWAPYTANRYPHYTNTINTNQNNPNWGPNIGVWFVRTIINPITPPVCTATCPWYDAPRSADCFLNAANNIECHLKFHNDRWTSTTDLHYFAPCMRPYGLTFALPTKGCAAVQVDTPVGNTVCHYEVVCPKPCQCMSQPCHGNTVSRPTSAMSLEDTKTKDDICECGPESSNPKQCGSTGNVQMHLLPSDRRNKRIKLDRRKQNAAKSKSKDVNCECSPPPCSDKSVATYANKANGGCPCKHGETQSCCEPTTIVSRVSDAIVMRSEEQQEMWCPNSVSSKRQFVRKSTKRNKNITDDSCSSSSCSCCSDTNEAATK